MEQKYNKVFVEVFGVTESVLNDDFSKDNVKEWDSVHQLNIVYWKNRLMSCSSRKISWDSRLTRRVKRYCANTGLKFKHVRTYGKVGN